MNIPGFSEEEHEALSRLAEAMRIEAKSGYEVIDGNYRVKREGHSFSDGPQNIKDFSQGLINTWQKQKKELPRAEFKPGPIALLWPKSALKDSDSIDLEIIKNFNVESYAYLTATGKSVVFEGQQKDGRISLFKTTTKNFSTEPVSPYSVQISSDKIDCSGYEIQAMSSIHLLSNYPKGIEAFTKLLSKLHEGTGVRVDESEIINDDIGILPDGTIIFPDVEIFIKEQESMSLEDIALHINAKAQEMELPDVFNPMTQNGEYKQKLLLPVGKDKGQNPELTL